jgi:hypothetical protein
VATQLPDFYRGDTYPPIEINYPGVDITGWIFTITLKAALDDTVPALQVQQVAGAGPLDDAANGKIILSITSAQTAALAVGRYAADIERRIPGSPDNVRTILFQKIKCLQDVTT